MQLSRVVIEADAKHEIAAMRLVEARQALADVRPQHRLHGVGQEQDLEAALERVAQHGDDVGIHERLAAGEADLAHGPLPVLDLIEIGDRLGAGDVGEAVVVGARFDIAIAAGDIAEAAGVDP